MSFPNSKLGRRIKIAAPLYVFKMIFWLSLPFLLAGWYNYTFLEWSRYTDPIEGSNYITDTDAPQRNDFRKRTVSSVTDPIRMQLAKIETLRKQSKGGTVKPPTLEKSAAEVRNRLKEIMTEARLRRIPVEFKSHYEPALYAIQDAYRSINALEECFQQETLAKRHQLYNESVQSWSEAMRKNNLTREFFMGDDWQKVGTLRP